MASEVVVEKPHKRIRPQKIPAKLPLRTHLVHPARRAALSVGPGMEVP